MSTQTFEAEGEAQPKRGPLLWTVLIVGALIVVATIASRLATDYLWFRSIDFQNVFTTQLAARAGLIVGFGLVMFLIVYFSQVIAYRLRPKVRRANLDSEFLVQLRDALDSKSRVLMAIPALALGVLGGLAASSATGVFLAWLHATPFGWKDPYFNIDAGYYVFTQPWLQFVVGFLLFAFIAGGVAALAVHFMTGAMNSSAMRSRGNTPASLGAQRQISVMLGIILLLVGANALLDRFALTVTPNPLFTGIGYTDFDVRMPVTIIIAAICVICAIACFVNAWKVRWAVPGASIALLIVSSLILGLLYPWLVQNFEVTPNWQDKERPYITNNIKATRYAYGI
ncbi:MAG TPA: UPF0182 family protein, partial [Tessaracoccus flavescens]|nr:UPF0182 family protein [Tessaracoccus flavescens]